MPWTKPELRLIYDRTRGYCHLCHCKMSFTNYGRFGERGAWEVEHSNARANGGTDHGNNLKGACISCNREKRDGSTRAARARNGVTRAPLSREAREEAQTENAVIGSGLGALAGAIFGLPGAIVGAIVGGIAGHSVNVK
jgi:5-methylcytosine-specific restriction endonuclease McrA